MYSIWREGSSNVDESTVNINMVFVAVGDERSTLRRGTAVSYLRHVQRGLQRLRDHVFTSPRIAAGNQQIAMHDNLAAFEGLVMASMVSLLFWSVLTYTIFRIL
jgi:hypothetical protein